MLPNELVNPFEVGVRGVKKVIDCVYRLLLKGRFPRPITNKAPPRVISNLRAPLCPRGDPSGSPRRGEEREVIMRI